MVALRVEQMADSMVDLSVLRKVAMLAALTVVTLAASKAGLRVDSRAVYLVESRADSMVG